MSKYKVDQLKKLKKEYIMKHFCLYGQVRQITKIS